MDLGAQVINNLQRWPISANLMHFVIDDWLWIQRNSFDQYNEQGEPFLSQFFLIEISTGRYIHRCQGQKIDQGSTLDLEILIGKLTRTFQGTKPCPGISKRKEDLSMTSAKMWDYPCPRLTSNQCQFYFKVPRIKPENEGDGSGSQYSGRCGPCHELSQELQARDQSIRGNNLISVDSKMEVDFMLWDGENEDLWAEEPENSLSPSNDFDNHDPPSLSSSNTTVIRDQNCGIPREFLCICCKLPFPTLYHLSKHRNQKRVENMEHVSESHISTKEPLNKMAEAEAVNDLSNKNDHTTTTAGNVGKHHKCSCCSVLFSTKNKLHKHKYEKLKINRSRRKVGCRNCKATRIMSFKELINHVAVVHPEKLDQHQEYLPTSQDLKTMKEPIECSICETLSNGRFLDLRHKGSYHTLGNHQCDTCQEPCLTYYDLMIHNYQKHGKSIDPIPVNLNGLTPNVDEEGNIAYTLHNVPCPICPKSFKYHPTWSKHMRRTHSWGKIRCKPCGEWSHFSKDISAHTLLFHKEKPEVECPNCRKMFNLKVDSTIFDNHFPKCAPKRTNKSYATKGPFQCQICGKEYSHSATLAGHLTMHQGTVKHKCQYCDFGSYKKQVVLTHEKIHLRKMGLLQEEPRDERGSQCEICGKQMTNRSFSSKRAEILFLFNMDLRSDLLEKLPTSMNLLHLEVENWITFQRNTFDHYDEGGDPFVCQIFLIEISTGRYIHRSQGQTVEQGTSLDVDVLTKKLTQVFQGSKPCPGIPIEKEGQPSKDWIILDYPFRRSVSLECQFYFQTPETKPEFIRRCNACQKCSSKISPHSLESLDLSLNSYQKSLEAEVPHLEKSMDVDYEVWDNEEEDIWTPSDCFIESEPVSEGFKSLSKKSDPIPKAQVRSAEYLCICCSKPFPTMYDLTKHRYETIKRLQSHLPSKNDTASTPKPDEKSPKKSSKVKSGIKNTDSTSVPNKEDVPGKSKKLYKCFCCAVDFPNIKELVQHKRRKEQEDRTRRKVGCLECEAPNIATFKELIKHVSLTHPDKLDEYEAYLHKDLDLETMKEPKTCSFCDMISNGRTMHQRHKENYHALGDYPCETCQKPCLTFYDLMIHNYQKHRKPMDFIPTNYFGVQSIVNDNGKITCKMDRMTCHLCLKVYKGSEGFAAHLRRIHSWGKLRCLSCEEWAYNSKAMSVHMLQFHKDKPEIECTNCQKKIDLTDDPKSFEIHFQHCLNTFNPKGPFQCQYCGKKYAYKTNLNGHVKMHQGIFRFKCQYCDFVANFTHVMAAHDRMHKEKLGLLPPSKYERRSTCDICGKELSSKGQVKKHIQIVHEGFKPTFQCKKCGEFFRYSAALHKHKVDAHGHVPKPLKY